MPRAFLPAVYPTGKAKVYSHFTDMNLQNCVPRELNNGEMGAVIRDQYDWITHEAASSADYGRGVISFDGEYDLYLETDTYYYDGGNQDLTATSSPGYAGNTGFYTKYNASFAEHSISGVNSLVIANAGHTSTHASAKHGNLWYQSAASAAPASVSDADMPGNNGVSITRGVVSLDGYVFLCDINGQIHNSNINDITTWTATDFLKASRRSDTGIYIGEHHDNVVYIGTKSIEFFYNAGNASGSPLSRRTDVSYSVGCYYPNSIVEVGDIIYFIGHDHAGWPRVYKLENFQLTAISSNEVEVYLKDLNVLHPSITDLEPFKGNMWITPLPLADSQGLALTWAAGRTFVWHEKTNLWNRWSCGIGSMTYGGVLGTNWLSVFPVVSFNGEAARGSGAGRYQLANGTVLQRKYNPTAATALIDLFETGQTAAADVYINFARWDGGTREKKRINWVRIVHDPMVGTAATFTPFPVDVRWLDFRRVQASAPTVPGSYTTGRSVELNTDGGRLPRQGICRQRQYLLDFTTGWGEIAPIQGLLIDYDIVGV